MKGWRVREKYTPSSSSEGDDAVMNDLRHRKPRPLLTQQPCTRCPCRLHARPTGEESDPAFRKQQRFRKRL